ERNFAAGAAKRDLQSLQETAVGQAEAEGGAGFHLLAVRRGPSGPVGLPPGRVADLLRPGASGPAKKALPADRGPVCHRRQALLHLRFAGGPDSWPSRSVHLGCVGFTERTRFRTGTKTDGGSRA